MFPLLVLVVGCTERIAIDEGDGGAQVDRPKCEGSGDNRPLRDEWQTEARVAFDHFDEATGLARITRLRIGGTLAGGSDRENFANRGDVFVRFDGPPDTIEIALRRFTFAPCEEAAEDDFEAVSLWAFVDVDPPVPPHEIDAASDCTGAEGWRDDCAIRIYYDGLSQLARTGADLRVTLPPDYAGDLVVVTDDNDADPDYFNRGDVCIDGARGNVDVTLQSGRARVKMADDTSIAPRCSAMSIQQCEAWPCADAQDACDGSLAWDAACPCLADVGEFGHVVVQTLEGAAADVTIDVPADLWMSMSLDNRQQPQDSSDPNGHCTAEVTVPGYETLEGPGNDFPWQARGHVNYPGPWAVRGAGLNVTTYSEACGQVLLTDSPTFFVGVGNGETQMSERRGDLEVCSGCLTNLGC